MTFKAQAITTVFLALSHMAVVAGPAPVVGDAEPPTLTKHIIASAAVSGLEPNSTQHLVSLAPLNNGRVVAAYRRGYTGSSENWHLVFDANGLVVPPQRTAPSLDSASGLNTGAGGVSQAKTATDGNSVFIPLLNSGHNNGGGNVIRVGADGAVLSQLGGTGSYHTRLCPVGSDLLVSSGLVDQRVNLLMQWYTGAQTLSWTTLSARNDYSNPQCGTSAALGQDFVLLIRESTDFKFELFSVQSGIWTPVGSTVSLTFPPGYTRTDLGTGGYAASGDDTGVVLHRAIDTDGRKVQFYSRFRITATGVSVIDTTMRQLPTSLSYETLDANITYGGDGQFFIAAYLGGNAVLGMPLNTRQAVRAYRLDFASGTLTGIGEHEDTNWTNSYGPGDVYGGWAPLQDYSAAVSCDGNLYIGGTLDNGAGKAQFTVFSLPVKAPTCAGALPDVSPQLSGTPSASGWLTGNASLDWQVDAHGRTETSRTGCETPSFTTDFLATTFGCAVTTSAGTGTGSVTIKRDATQPQAWTFVGPTLAASGWFTVPVTVNFTGSDATSGIATCSDPVTVSSDGANQTSPSGTCVDVAGNTSSPVTATALNIDRTAPALVPALSAPANTLGWHKSAVTVSFPGTDAMPGSGIKTCSPSMLVSTDVTARSVSGTCGDIAGNSTTTAVTINLDKVVPGVTITRPLNGGSYAQGQSLTASFKCSDTRSGVATCAGTQTTGSAISTSTTGSATFTVDAADRADNTSKKTSNYTILPASFALSPASLSFGTMTAGLLSQAQVITLTNTGQASLPLSSIKVTGTNATHFALTHSCPSSIATGSACPINVSFKPSSSGAKVAAVTVTMNAGDTKVKTVSVAGTGAAATYSLSPTSINFGAVAVGNASSTRIVGITNTSTIAMPIKSILLTGTNPGDFVSGHTCGTEVPVGGNCQISLSFQPAAGGSKTAKITVSPGAGASVKSVSLSGTGSEPPISSATPLDIPTGTYSEEMAFDGANL